MSKQLALEFDLKQMAADNDIPGADVADAEEGFAALISKYLGVIMTLAALILLVYLIWGAIEWITSEGDKGKLEKARNKITQAVIGMIVLAASLAIFSLVQNLLGIEVLTFN